MALGFNCWPPRLKLTSRSIYFTKEKKIIRFCLSWKFLRPLQTRNLYIVTYRQFVRSMWSRILFVWLIKWPVRCYFVLLLVLAIYCGPKVKNKINEFFPNLTGCKKRRYLFYCLYYIKKWTRLNRTQFVYFLTSCRRQKLSLRSSANHFCFILE